MAKTSTLSPSHKPHKQEYAQHHFSFRHRHQRDHFASVQLQCSLTESDEGGGR